MFGEILTDTHHSFSLYLFDSAEHAKTQNADGLLTTSLCEDVYSLVGMQHRTIRERLTKRSEVLVLAVDVFYCYLRMKQQ